MKILRQYVLVTSANFCRGWSTQNVTFIAETFLIFAIILVTSRQNTTCSLKMVHKKKKKNQYNMLSEEKREAVK